MKKPAEGEAVVHAVRRDGELVEVKLAPAPSISELEAILSAEEEVPIDILPNGEVRARSGARIGKKPLTMRENLGGEYGA